MEVKEQFKCCLCKKQFQTLRYKEGRLIEPLKMKYKTCTTCTCKVFYRYSSYYGYLAKTEEEIIDYLKKKIKGIDCLNCKAHFKMARNKKYCSQKCYYGHNIDKLRAYARVKKTQLKNNLVATMAD